MSNSSSKITRLFCLSDHTKQKLNIKRAYQMNNVFLQIDNAKTEPIICRPFTGKDEHFHHLEQILVARKEYEREDIKHLVEEIFQDWYRKEKGKAIAAAAEDAEEEKNKTRWDVHKYSKDIHLAEAVLVGHKAMFLQIVDGKAKLSEKIPLPDSDIMLHPIEEGSYLSKEYQFSSKEEIEKFIEKARRETLDTLFEKVKAVWAKYIDAEEYHLIICAADTIFTYFQDRIGMTHYLFFVG